MPRTPGCWLSCVAWLLCLAVQACAGEESPALPVQLTKASFEPYLRGLDPDVGVLLELYAHW